MSSLLDFLRDHGTTIRALIALTLASTVCSVVGCFIILRRMSFLADALAHSMLAGVVVGYLTMKAIFSVEASAPGMIVGALLAGIVTVALIGFVTRVSRIKQDTAIGIMYTGIFALGGFLATYKPLASLVHVDLYHFVVGSVLSVTDSDLWTLTVVVIVVLACIILFYRHLKLVAFDPVMAAAIGVPVLAVDYLLTGCTSLVVVWGVGIVGVVLVVALIVTPAATAYLIHDRLDRMLLTAVVVSIVSSWLGYALATWSEVAPGPAIVLMGTIVFLVVLIASPKYGVIAARIKR
ncbi:MAG: metal ABC transporter permease, partial [Pirellulaceae bacterium]